MPVPRHKSRPWRPSSRPCPSGRDARRRQNAPRPRRSRLRFSASSPSALLRVRRLRARGRVRRLVRSRAPCQRTHDFRPITRTVTALHRLNLQLLPRHRSWHPARAVQRVHGPSRSKVRHSNAGSHRYPRSRHFHRHTSLLFFHRMAHTKSKTPCIMLSLYTSITTALAQNATSEHSVMARGARHNAR